LPCGFGGVFKNRRIPRSIRRAISSSPRWSSSLMHGRIARQKRRTERPGGAANAVGSEGTMMKRLVVRYRTCLCLLGATLSLLSSPASAQQLTQAQIDAIRQACPGDYQTYCRTVPTGGPAALNCLKQNYAGLTAGCHKAIGALNGGAAAGGSATPTVPPGQR
jgi:hypothetical protein